MRKNNKRYFINRMIAIVLSFLTIWVSFNLYVSPTIQAQEMDIIQNENDKSESASSLNQNQENSANDGIQLFDDSSNIKRNTEINPIIKIEHYLYFSAVSLGKLSKDGNQDNPDDYNGVTYYERIKNDWATEPWDSGEKYKHTDLAPKDGRGTTLPIYNTERRWISSASGIPENGDAKAEYGVVVNETGNFSTHIRLKQLFLDEYSEYLKKPQIAYMNRLYHSNQMQNAHYTLREIWIAKEEDHTISYTPYEVPLKYDNQGRPIEDGVLETSDTSEYEVPLKYDNQGRPIEDEVLETSDTSETSSNENSQQHIIYLRDPSRVIFTNNENYAIDGKELDKDSFGNSIPTYYGEKANQTLVIPVFEKMIVRFVFDPTNGSVDEDVNFFDYDISDGSIYSTINDAQQRKNPQTTSSQTNTQTWYMATNNQGINSDQNYQGDGRAKLSFGNAFSGIGAASDVAIIDDIPNYINRRNLANTYNKSDGKTVLPGTGSVFGLASNQLDEETGNLIWSENIDAPPLFTPNTKIKTEGKKDYINNEYSLNFKRSGNTYILQKVRDNKTNQDVTGDLTKLFKTNNGGGGIYSNEFWPMDHAESWGTNGHDMKFGRSDLKDYRKFIGKKSENKKSFINKNVLETDSYLSNKNNYIYNPSDYSNKPSPETGTLLTTDIGSKDHNAFFGMKFDIDFYLDPGYAGPLRYYFYGDDDLFVYLSEIEKDSDGNEIIKKGTSKLITDIGGVHPSVGMYVNLWNHIGTPIDYVDEEGNPNEIRHYRLSFFYTERGASGSTCYMRFTVPFRSLTTDTSASKGNLKVEKEVKASSVHQQNQESKKEKYIFALNLGVPATETGEEGNNAEFIETSTDSNKYSVYYYSSDHMQLSSTDPNLQPATISNGERFVLEDGQYALIVGLPQKKSENIPYRFKVEEVGIYDNLSGKTYGSDLAKPLEYYCKPINNSSTSFKTGYYRISESGEPIWDLGEEVYAKDKTHIGDINVDNYVHFINADFPGILKLKKTINTLEGSSDPGAAFTFNVSLKTKEKSDITSVPALTNIRPSGTEKPISGGYYKYGTDGVITAKEESTTFQITLKAGEEIVLYDLPAGTQYIITESSDPVQGSDKALYQHDLVSITRQEGAKEIETLYSSTSEPAEEEEDLESTSSKRETDASSNPRIVSGNLPEVTSGNTNTEYPEIAFVYTNKILTKVHWIKITKKTETPDEIDNTIGLDDQTYIFRVKKKDPKYESWTHLNNFSYSTDGGLTQVKVDDQTGSSGELIYLSAKQTASIFIPVDSNQSEPSYVVEEIIPEEQIDRYERIEVSINKNNPTIISNKQNTEKIGETNCIVYRSGSVTTSNGNSEFEFIITNFYKNKLATISIEKLLPDGITPDEKVSFGFQVTVYQPLIGNEDLQVGDTQIFQLKASNESNISNESKMELHVLLGSYFKVEEIIDSSSQYEIISVMPSEGLVASVNETIVVKAINSPISKNIQIKKVDAEDTNTPLQASFQLYSKYDPKKVITHNTDTSTISTKKFEGKDYFYNSQIDTTNGSQTISLKPNSSYVLEEIQAPNGYTLLNKPIYFTTNSSGEINDNSENWPSGVTLVENNFTLQISNRAIPTLPSAGGPGTDLYTAGLAAAGLAGLWVDRRYRFSKEKGRHHARR